MPCVRRDNAAMSTLRFPSAPARQTLRRTARFAALAAVVAGASAAAAPTPQASPTSLAPMRFIRVASSAPGCKSDCPEWISAEGKIVTGTAEALERVVAKLNGRRLPIFSNSAGGSVKDAMAMGRLIRAKNLAVVVAHTAVAPCPASATSCGEAHGSAESLGAYCASACTLVLAGGVERYVSALSFVGVHQLTQVVNKTEINRSYSVRYLDLAGLKFEISRKLVAVNSSTSTSKRVADRRVDDRVAAYLQEMGIGDPVMQLMLATPARDVRWLTPEELGDSGLATIRIDGASPIVDGDGASGVGGEPVDADSGGGSLFVATSVLPLALPPEDRPSQIEASFAYRRGGATVLARFLARDAKSGAPVDFPGSQIVVGAVGETARGAAPDAGPAEPRRVLVPLRSFCDFARAGSAPIGFIDPGANKGEGPQPAAPLAALDLTAATGAKPLLEEACAQTLTASR
jgi:hypothetical protein